MPVLEFARCARANARLHYLKRLKRACLSDRLAIWYTSVIKPVLEYCAVVGRNLAPRLQEISDRNDRGDPEASYSHIPYFAVGGWHCSLFQTGATNSAAIFFANCLHHLLQCCYPLVTLKSRLGLEEQPRIVDPVTLTTATNLSFITTA